MSQADGAVEAQDVEGLKPQVRRSPPQAPGPLRCRKRTECPPPPGGPQGPGPKVFLPRGGGKRGPRVPKLWPGDLKVDFVKCAPRQGAISLFPRKSEGVRVQIRFFACNLAL